MTPSAHLTPTPPPRELVAAGRLQGHVWQVQTSLPMVPARAGHRG